MTKIITPDSVSRLTRRSVLTGLTVGAGLAVTKLNIIGRANAADTITMKYGSDSPMSAPHTKSAVVMKELVEERTKGRVKVTIFPDGQLGSNDEMTNAVKAGTLDAVTTDTSVMSSAVAQADIFNLPFLFGDTRKALAAANGDVGTYLKPMFNKAFNIETVGFATDGARNYWNSKRLIKGPEDMKGLKMRASSSKIQRDTFSRLGAIPTPVSFSETYTALQTGVIDGGDHAPVDMVEMKIYQVTKFMTLTHHINIVSVLVVSDKFMAKLTPEDQDIVRAAGKEAADAQVEAVLAKENEAIAELKAKGIEMYQPETTKPFADLIQAVYASNEERVTKDLLDKARSYA
ncbi:ABC transporter substrate-binding protein [Terrihabitans soli]|uniref:ABC transporter substrate-binding protein n=1 Tax=Terrihabitans soli TaxID=708113 RepID=A0A6S6QET5_9HYPH|nr:TRAP transporter substrate-binding protein [Terrihabitans soli]BCJ89623.1 ABC transporter substrate-binding protein [Terrihabitans soli]